ncbi:MAG TPA: helix-turn-helix domain-containing protein [Mycobacterium sp.]|nr:helix-turn-helix domain-containing protein [Mycobacterium sp.]
MPRGARRRRRADGPGAGRSPGGTRRAFQREMNVAGMERETGFEPATLSLGRRRTHPAPRRVDPQPSESTASSDVGFPQPAHRTASTGRKFGATLGATVKQKFGPRLASTEYTVREIAECLRVSTATVYRLCRRGELEHHRVSHAIRVPGTAVTKYLATAASNASGRPPGHGG